MNETPFHAELVQGPVGRQILVLEQRSEHLTYRVLPFVGSDIDGTVTPEEAQEQDKISLTDQARRAFATYEQLGMRVWLITSRTFGEVGLYQQALGIHGGAIFEEGIGIELPNGADTHRISERLGIGFIISHGDSQLLIRAPKNGIDAIAHVFHAVEEQTSPLISSLVYESENLTGLNEKKVQLLAQTAGHHSLEAAIASTVRFASAYVSKPHDEQRTLLTTLVGENPSLRMRDHGHVIEVYASHENKGTALQFIALHPELFYPMLYINKLYPIVFGNRPNDFEMLKFAQNGIGVLVAGPEPGRYYLSNEELAALPKEVSRTQGVAGDGLVEALSMVLNAFQSTFGLNLINPNNTNT